MPLGNVSLVSFPRVKKSRLQLFQELFSVLFIILSWLRCPCRWLGMPWSEHCSDPTATDFSLGTRLFRRHGHHGPLKSNMQLLKYPFWHNFYAKSHDIHASRTSQRIELAERCLPSKPAWSIPSKAMSLASRVAQANPGIWLCVCHLWNLHRRAVGLVQSFHSKLKESKRVLTERSKS